MIKFMIWIFSMKKYDEIYDEIYVFFGAGIFRFVLMIV